jgi:hypothetical protein
MKFEKLVPGMVLYQRRKQRMGNTSMRELAEFPVRIISVDPIDRSAVVSWNGNREETWYERRLSKLKDWSMHGDQAEVVKGAMGRVISVKKKRKGAKP